MIKLKRGQKLCKSCNNINAARQQVCKHCGHNFINKNTLQKNEVKDWRQLEKGNCIKIIQGSGPYYKTKRDSEEARAGERICMGVTGVYEVVKKESHGLLVCGASPKNGGFSFLYMGKPYYSEETGIYNKPYRIKKVKYVNNRNSNNRKRR